MTDIIHSVFTDVAWDANLPAEAPTGVNGAGVMLDLNTPTDHIAKIAKFVVNDQNDISLRHTIAYVLAISNDNPQDQPAEALADEVLVTAASWIGCNVIRHEFHQIFHKICVDMTFRQTDTVAVDSLDNILHGNLAWYLGQADRVWGMLVNTEGAIERITTFRQEAAKAIIANANHRELEERHNWYTNNQNIEGTSTCRLLACGGSGIDRFRVFMGSYGHDMWHYMDDTTIRKAAHMLAGNVCERYDRPDPDDEDAEAPTTYHDSSGRTDLEVYGNFVRDSSGEPFRPNGPVILEDFSIGGIVYSKIPINRVIDVGQAAADRFPGNMIGVAGLITGVQAIISMISSVSSVVVIPESAVLIRNFTTLGSKFTEAGLARSTLLELKTELQNVVSYAYGYCQEMPELKDHSGQYNSLASYARRAADHMARGAIFARRMREVTTDPGAVENMIAQAFNSLSAAIGKMGDVEGLQVGPRDFADVPEVSAQIYRTADQIANEVSRRRAAAELLESDDED
jgi:hypothetical protein